jgi:hypothetical protein
MFFGALYNEDPDLSDTQTVGMLWSSHGDEDGCIQTAGGDTIRWEAIDGARVSRKFRLLIFSACHVGRWEDDWKRALGGARVYGWGKPMSFGKAVDFYTPSEETRNDLDDILERELWLPEGSIAATFRILQGVSPDGNGAVTEEEHFHGVAEIAAQSLGCLGEEGVTVDEEDGIYTYNLAWDDGRAQQVNVFLEPLSNPWVERYLPEGSMIFVESPVGPTSSIVDYRLLLQMTAEFPPMCRVLMTCAVGEEPERLWVQAMLPVGMITGGTLTYLVQKVGENADRLEETIFGSDEA